MDKRQLGKDSPYVSVVAFGAWRIGCRVAGAERSAVNLYQAALSKSSLALNLHPNGPTETNVGKVRKP